MAENDFFVNEVNTDMREENLYKQLKKYRWVIFAVVLGVVAFVAWNEFRASSQKANGQAQYQALEKSLEGDGSELDALDGKTSILSDLQRAKQLRDAGDLEGAKAIYQQIAADGQSLKASRELAKLQILSIEGGDAGELANPDGAFRAEARLLEAQGKLNAGDTKGALDILIPLMDASQTQGERALIESVVLSLGGEIPDIDPADELPEPVDPLANEEDNGEL